MPLFVFCVRCEKEPVAALACANGSNQTLEVVEAYHLQLGPGESFRQFLADGFENTDILYRSSWQRRSAT
jgi:hypothetical protein